MGKAAVLLDTYLPCPEKDQNEQRSDFCLGQDFVGGISVLSFEVLDGH